MLVARHFAEGGGVREGAGALIKRAFAKKSDDNLTVSKHEHHTHHHTHARSTDGEAGTAEGEGYANRTCWFVHATAATGCSAQLSAAADG